MDAHGPKFEVNIEGQLYPWTRDTITVPEIRELGHFPTDMPVIEVDLNDNTERTLAEDEVVELKPGKGFGKKVSFKRGAPELVQRELSLLRASHPNLDYREDGHWVRLPRYATPDTLWGLREVQVCFQIPEGLPGQAPYGFHVQPDLLLRDGTRPENYAYPVTTPFGDGWGKFSWRLEPWRPAADPVGGTNMVNFVRSFADRLRQGR
jgi:hypothetical protein